MPCTGFEDVVIGHAVGDAAIKVFYAVGRVHDAGAVIGGGVVGQVDGAQAVVARVHMGERGASEL